MKRVRVRLFFMTRTPLKMLQFLNRVGVSMALNLKFKSQIKNLKYYNFIANPEFSKLQSLVSFIDSISIPFPYHPVYPARAWKTLTRFGNELKFIRSLFLKLYNSHVTFTCHMPDECIYRKTRTLDETPLYIFQKL